MLDPSGLKAARAKLMDIDPETGSLISSQALEKIITAYLEATGPSGQAPLEGVVKIEHDSFEGELIGRYVTREGKRGVVLQQVGTKVVHVYGEKWLSSALLPASPTEKRD